jgi:hypothetical protein
MSVQKLGKIFDPRDHELANGCREFAQSPQTLMLADGLRVYFSTRAVDPEGRKYRSHIAFVDYETDLKTIRRVSGSTVIALGGLGCFDEHGIFPMNVLRVGDEVWGYTCGWNRRVSVSVDTAIGLAISRDGGETFARQGSGPVLGPSLHEPFLVGDGFVIRVGNHFHMWYIFGQRWVRETPSSLPDRVYKIAHSTSENGRDWLRQDGRAILPDVLGANECQALPSVVHFEGRYHMVFCFRDIHGFRHEASKGYRLGYAWSRDLETWHREDARLGMSGSSGEWDADMQCYPHFFVFDDTLFLLYNGNAFGREGFGLARVDVSP